MKRNRYQLFAYIITSILGSLSYGFILYNQFNNTLGFYFTPIDLLILVGILTSISLIALLPLVLVVRNTLNNITNLRKQYQLIYTQTSVYFFLLFIITSTLMSNYYEGNQAITGYFISLNLAVTLHLFLFKSEHSKKVNT